MKTLDMMLIYYDNPFVLSHWFHRLVNFSDFQKFSDRCIIWIADTGSPRDKIQASVDVVKSQPEWIKERIRYIRCETDEIRAKVPSDIDARPMCHAKNLVALNLSKADIILTSMVGQVFTPKYFEIHFAKHIQDPKAVVQGRRFDILDETYHTEGGYLLSWQDLIQKYPLHTSGGWPDISVRRHWLEEIGGWDEDFIMISPDDMDMGSRLTGKLDNGADSERLFTGKPKFDNLGLNLIQPFGPDFCSLTCNTYPGHTPKGNSRRQKGYDIGEQIYLKKWGQIVRNVGRVPVQYEDIAI